MIRDNPTLLAKIDPNHCFAAGTPIVLADGSTTLIEDIHPGDIILAFDPAENSGRGALKPCRVTRIFRNETEEWIELSNGLTVTPGHRFLDQYGMFRTIEDILATDGTIVLEDGSLEQVTGKIIVYSQETADLYEQAEAQMATHGALALAPAIPGWQTYNFEVEDLHTYIAGGVRVHNDSILSFMTPAEIANLVDLRYDENNQPYYAVIQVPGSNTEFQYTLNQEGTQATVEATFSDGAGNLLYQISQCGPGGERISAEPPIYLTGQQQGAQLAGALTPFLTNAFLDDDASLFEEVATETVMATLLENLGEVIGGTIHSSQFDPSGGSVMNNANGVS